jgi:hypothetical protein
LPLTALLVTGRSGRTGNDGPDGGRGLQKIHGAGFPLNAEALLLIELDGLAGKSANNSAGRGNT